MPFWKVALGVGIGVVVGGVIYGAVKGYKNAKVKDTKTSKAPVKHAKKTTKKAKIVVAA